MDDGLQVLVGYSIGMLVGLTGYIAFVVTF